jgi:hypothetical protein
MTCACFTVEALLCSRLAAEGKGQYAFHDYVPHPCGKRNELAKAGTLGSTIQSIMEELKPEAAYFTDIEGGRGGYIVLNMDDASQIPAIAEPLFLGLGATIQLHPVMTPEDLGKAAPAIEQAAKKYG